VELTGIASTKPILIFSMKTCRTIEEIRFFSASLRRSGRKLSFVPTMGFLHEGHLSLIDIARSNSDAVVVSIFVNPTQFGSNEDLDSYPRDLERDMKLCEARNVDALFLPSSEDYYESDASTWVIEQELSRDLCGVSRPDHFKGVTTVLAKLFNTVLPDSAVFGEKDFQQVAIVKRMVRDLNFPVEILTGPIIREHDGLAMSSRNKYLSGHERQNALTISKSLFDVKNKIHHLEFSVFDAVEYISNLIVSASGRIDYVKIVDPDTLLGKNNFSGSTLIAIAAFFGTTRLIDNILIHLPIEE